MIRPPVLYHYSYSFADAAVPELISRIAGVNQLDSENLYRLETNQRSTDVKKLRNHRTLRLLKRLFRHRRQSGILTLGSIFHCAKNADIVWGTGINPTHQMRVPKQNLENVDIRAVRGPLTRNFIREKYKLECPEVYGDPGLLIPDYFPELNSEYKSDNYIVMFQHFDEPFVRKNYDKYKDFNVYLCQKPDRTEWKSVVRQICKAKLVIASTMHAVIIAEAFGIPAIWLHDLELPSSWSEGSFKYNDYLMATGREPYTCVSSIQEGLDRGGGDPVSGWNKEALLGAFPIELSC